MVQPLEVLRKRAFRAVVVHVKREVRWIGSRGYRVRLDAAFDIVRDMQRISRIRVRRSQRRSQYIAPEERDHIALDRAAMARRDDEGMAASNSRRRNAAV